MASIDPGMCDGNSNQPMFIYRIVNRMLLKGTTACQDPPDFKFLQICMDQKDFYGFIFGPWVPKNPSSPIPKVRAYGPVHHGYTKNHIYGYEF